ncbi:unnamed protein product [Laminaria digitata]
MSDASLFFAFLHKSQDSSGSRKKNPRAAPGRRENLTPWRTPTSISGHHDHRHGARAREQAARPMDHGGGGIRCAAHPLFQPGTAGGSLGGHHDARLPLRAPTVRAHARHQEAPRQQGPGQARLPPVQRRHDRLDGRRNV